MKFRLPVLIILILAAFTACQKDDPAPVVPLTTRLLVANASTDAFNIFQNGNRLNREASLYPNGLSGYLTVAAGQQNYQLKRMGSPDALVSTAFNLDSLTNYSLYVAGLNGNDYFLLNDTYTTDTTATAMVRFVNASPDSIRLDLALRNIVDEDDDSTEVVTTVINDVAYKSGSVFKPAVSGSVQLRIFRAGSLTALFTDTVSLQTSQGYSIFAKGRPGQTGDGAFGAGLITH